MPLVVARVLLLPVVFTARMLTFARRVFFAQPLFRGYLSTCGKGLTTGHRLHYVSGSGVFRVGDYVALDGVCSFIFAARYSAAPTLVIGSRTGVGHDCSFVVGSSITIGEDCRFGRGVWVFDSPGHPIAAGPRRQGLPAPADTVKPVAIGNNVWLGSFVTVLPGSIIGENSVIATGCIVSGTIPPNSLVVAPTGRRIADVPAE